MKNPLKLLLLTAVGAMICSIHSEALGNPGPGGAVMVLRSWIQEKCEVLTQPASLAMSYDPVSDTAKLGTSSFTYQCTEGSEVTVTPSSQNRAGGWNWEAKNRSMYLLYTLYNDNTCTSHQLKNGSPENIRPLWSNANQTYEICAIPNRGQKTLRAGSYKDTVTFTFDFDA